MELGSTNITSPLNRNHNVLALTLTITNQDLKKTRLLGKMHANAAPLTGITCLLERCPGQMNMGGQVRIEGVGREPLAATVARAISAVIITADSAPLDLGKLRSLKVQGHSGATLVVESLVWNGPSHLIGRSGGWDMLSGAELSAWQIAMHALCDEAFGQPQLAVAPTTQPLRVYRDGNTVHCRTRDLPADQQRMFEVLHCLDAPLSGAVSKDACSPFEMDAFLCYAESGYRHSSVRDRFWSEYEFQCKFL